MIDNKHAIDIKAGDILQAAITLHRAFEKDPMMQWMFVSKENYEKNGIATIKTWIKYCMLYGKAFRTEGFESIALRRRPGDINVSSWHLFRAGMLKTPKPLNP